MNLNEQEYIRILKQHVYDKIAIVINEQTIDEIVEKELYSHINNKKSNDFHDYYFQTLNNEVGFVNSADFFRKFKRRYALQGIDNNYLDRLEENKQEILELIRADNLAKLYFENFNKAKIKHGDNFKEKDLSSFFTKLVHTFKPNEYCALDNPIRKYFGLSKESFFIAFLTISVEYKHWTNDNLKLVELIRERFRQLDKDEVIKQDRLTDLKLLDLIFWSKANRGH